LAGVQAPTSVELRQAVLAVSVLCDVDLEPNDDGVTLPGSPTVLVPWTECLHALAGHDPFDDAGRTRLTDWLRARRWCADAGPDALAERLRPVGLPLEHVLHPGLDWVRERVLGDALDLGLGAVGLDPAEPDQVVLLPTAALDAAGLDTGLAWTGARERLEVLGALAAERSLRDGKGLLRPYGDCDVVTLLGARSLRSALAGAAGGMAAAVVPMRRRGWTRLSLIDPAFGPAAAAATEPAERGFDRPLLITPDELAVVGAGGRPQAIVLRDPAVDAPWVRDTLYH
jgi:hypothetical protein